MVVSTFAWLVALMGCGTAVKYDGYLRLCGISRRELTNSETHQGVIGIGRGTPALKKSQYSVAVSCHGEYGPPEKIAAPTAL
ncbi:unnamed protein product [Toxocara canis]|uniref:Uncharacterized protein n=1 Tax=Toxocara canis TaxID=6265 RepID=A0A183TXR4_TOXCA|nr:unnamed protein product [Toxocara canis]